MPGGKRQRTIDDSSSDDDDDDPRPTKIIANESDSNSYIYQPFRYKHCYHHHNHHYHHHYYHPHHYHHYHYHYHYHYHHHYHHHHSYCNSNNNYRNNSRVDITKWSIGPINERIKATGWALNYVDDAALHAVIINSTECASVTKYQFKSLYNPKRILMDKVSNICEFQSRQKYHFNCSQDLILLRHICCAVVRDENVHLSHNYRQLLNFLKSIMDLQEFIKSDDVDELIQLMDWHNSNTFITKKGWILECKDPSMKSKLGALNLKFECAFPTPPYDHRDFTDTFPETLLQLFLPVVGSTLNSAKVFDETRVIISRNSPLYDSVQTLSIVALQIPKVVELRSRGNFDPSHLRPFDLNLDDPLQLMPLVHSAQDENTKHILESELWPIPQNNSKFEEMFLASGRPTPVGNSNT